MADTPPVTPNDVAASPVEPAEDPDLTVLKDAGDAAFTLGVQAKVAMKLNKPDAYALKAQSDKAHNAYSLARLTLLEPETSSSTGDVAAMQAIKQQIDAAATVQTQIQGAVSLIGFLAKFV